MFYGQLCSVSNVIPLERRSEGKDHGSCSLSNMPTLPISLPPSLLVSPRCKADPQLKTGSAKGMNPRGEGAGGARGPELLW